jgi:hypothetical protein
MRRWAFWTNHTVAQEAAKFLTRTAFAKGASGAYDFACDNGILDEVCHHMPTLKNKPYQKEDVIRLAKTVKNIAEFERKHSGAYAAVRKNNWQKEIEFLRCKQTPFSLETLKFEACKYQSRKAFELGSSSAYQAARKMGVLNDVCQHMAARRKKWSLSDLALDALRFTSRKEWELGSCSAYQTALARGVADELCEHMVTTRPDPDTVYLWKAVGCMFNNAQVYKIGITHSRSGFKRIFDCAKANEIEAEIVFCCQVADPRKLERKFLRYGMHPGYKGTDGATEFRALTENEVLAIKNKVFENSFAGVARA